jgi:2'-5' RNA ligase
MIRLFAAIVPPAEIAEALARRQTGLPGARWHDPAKLHITLRFIGDIAEHAAEDLDAELAAVRSRRFELTLAGVGAFGEGHGVSAIWAGVERSEPLKRLAARCETAARRAGLPPDTRAYKPHLTLAYVRGAEPARVAAWIAGHNLLKSPPFEVAAFGLYSTWRTASGSHYRLERCYPLA